MQPTPEQQIQFLKNMQRLLSEGRFTATYKYALLLALADIAVEHGNDSGESLKIPTNLIAEKFIQYYWRQAAPYMPRHDPAAGKVLLQNTGSQAEIVRFLVKTRDSHGGTISSFRHDGKKWPSLVKRTDRVIRVMPLWKLQKVGQSDFDFLYANEGKGSVIELRPGVAFCLRQFYGLVGDLVRGSWIRFVRSLNNNQDVLGSTVDLQEFLFGSERSALTALTPMLIDLQHGNCFYCSKSLSRSQTHVDLGHNFVLAHEKCNSAKADHIAAAIHLDRWCERNAQSASQMDAAFDEQGFVHQLPTSLRIAEWAYRQVELAKGLTWQKGRTMIELPGSWNGRLESLMLALAQ